MKLFSKSGLLLLCAATIGSVLFFACSKNHNGNNNNSGQPRLQVKLVDKPIVDAKEVWVNIQQVEIMEADSSEPIMLDGTHPGMYNLLEFTGGKDTLLADASIPAGTISQIRLILGDGNYLVTGSGDTIDLKTPSAQESGLKVMVNQDVSGGTDYSLTLDFDASRSIVKAGNSGMYLLKPVLRIVSFTSTGGSNVSDTTGNLQGVVLPDSIRTSVFALMGSDTIASTSTDTTSGSYMIQGIPAGNYTLSFAPSDSTYKDTMVNTMITAGQTTTVDTVMLSQ